MEKPVFTSARADLQILEIDAWWRANRDKAPDLFEEELALAFRTLAAAPRGREALFAPEREGATNSAEVDTQPRLLRGSS